MVPGDFRRTEPQDRASVSGRHDHGQRQGDGSVGERATCFDDAEPLPAQLERHAPTQRAQARLAPVTPDREVVRRETYEDLDHPKNAASDHAALWVDLDL